MPHWRTFIEKDYLGAWDLVDKSGTPKDYTLEMLKVSSQSLKTREQPKGKRKCVINFKGAQKAMVANTTNCEILENLYGPDTNGWIGKTITLYQGDVRSPKGGGTIKGVKVRPQVPRGKAETIEIAPVNEEMRAAQNEAFGREPGEER